jgi:hypothetical protein
MMSQVPSTIHDPTSDGRAVLLWRPDTDTSDVCPDVEHVARRLSVEPAAVIAAIRSGDLLEGWFVDWQVADVR